jgi:hypothetical protein
LPQTPLFDSFLAGEKGSFRLLIVITTGDAWKFFHKVRTPVTKAARDHLYKKLNEVWCDKNNLLKKSYAYISLSMEMEDKYYQGW